MTFTVAPLVVNLEAEGIGLTAVELIPNELPAPEKVVSQIRLFIGITFT
jgi:hypothetical protein